MKLGQAPSGNVISAYRYWFDDGNTAIVTLPIPSPAKVVWINTTLPIPQLSGSAHKVNIQIRDTSQVWSGVFSQNFVTCPSGFPPGAAGTISGITMASTCSNQNGISYSIDTIPNASIYLWTLPPLASIVGNADTNKIVVNYSPYSASGNISVAGVNACGTGISSTLAINYKPIPIAEICKATVDSATQKTLLEWQKPLETYVNGYVIYRETPIQSGNYSALDTVPDAVFSSYLDTSNLSLSAESTTKMTAFVS